MLPARRGFPGDIPRSFAQPRKDAQLLAGLAVAASFRNDDAALDQAVILRDARDITNFGDANVFIAKHFHPFANGLLLERPREFRDQDFLLVALDVLIVDQVFATQSGA